MILAIIGQDMGRLKMPALRVAHDPSLKLVLR